MSIDEEFYKLQTHIRGALSNNELIKLCESEASRIQPIISEEIVGVKLNHNPQVLDAPCGYGNLLYLYKKNGINAYGFDLDKKQVELAKSIGLSANEGDILDISSKNQYDLISSFDFIEHISKDNALVILNKFYSLLVDGGYLIIRTPSGDSPFGLRDFAEDPTHKWIGTSVCIKSMLSIAGFSDVIVKEDWPRYRKFNYVRSLIGKFFRTMLRMFLIGLGFGNPACLSTSMIMIARKNKQHE